jgi:hypothetical protein
MKKPIGRTVYLAIGALWFALTVPLSATTIFDNSVHDLTTRFNPGTLEVGDEVLLGSTERYLTNFSFEYWGLNTLHSNSFSGAVEARVKFYLNDGTVFNGYAAPGTVLYDSGWFSVSGPTARSTFVFTAGSDGIASSGLYLPSSDITWSVQFSGMGTGDRVGVDIYSPPVVGQDYPDYWENNVGLTDWTMMTNSVPMDFAAKMDAMVPEPSSLALSLLGGMGILFVMRRLRRQD